MKFRNIFIPAAILAGSLAFAGTASAAVTGGGSHGGGSQQMCPQGSNDRGNGKNDQGGCGCQEQSGGQKDQDWGKGCEQCKTVSEWVRETVRVRTWWGWKTEIKWVCKDVQVCKPYNPGPPQQGGGCGCGNNQGGGNQGGNGGGQGGCKPQTIVFDFPADGTTVTEVSGPAVHNGEVVTYDSQTYTIGGVSGKTFTVEQGGSPVTNTGDTITDGQAQTVCAVS